MTQSAPGILTEVEFAHGTMLHRESDRRSDLRIVGNGPPGTFVVIPQGLRVSLPTDQIVRAEDIGGRVCVAFGGMRFDGVADGRLMFSRVRELYPEEQLSPARSYTMILATEWIAAVIADGRRVWPSTVYKIVPVATWRSRAASGSFVGSAADERDGFIHFSTARQVHETAARHFAGVEDLLLVAVAVEQLELRWEPSRGGDSFPHLYGVLPLTAVRWIRDLPLGADGRHAFPDLE